MAKYGSPGEIWFFALHVYDSISIIAYEIHPDVMQPPIKVKVTFKVSDGFKIKLTRIYENIWF